MTGFKASSLRAQRLDWSQSVLDENYLRITVEILLRICSQSTQRIRSRAQKLLLISSPTQFAMFQRQELTLSLNRVIAIEFPNCDPRHSLSLSLSLGFSLRGHGEDERIYPFYHERQREGSVDYNLLSLGNN